MLKIVIERKRKGLTQFELARRTGIHPANLSRLERGIWPPTSGWKRRIAKALDWPLDKADDLFEEVPGVELD